MLPRGHTWIQSWDRTRALNPKPSLPGHLQGGCRWQSAGAAAARRAEDAARPQGSGCEALQRRAGRRRGAAEGRGCGGTGWPRGARVRVARGGGSATGCRRRVSRVSGTHKGRKVGIRGWRSGRGTAKSRGRVGAGERGVGTRRLDARGVRLPTRGAPLGMPPTHRCGGSARQGAGAGAPAPAPAGCCPRRRAAQPAPRLRCRGRKGTGVQSNRVEGPPSLQGRGAHGSGRSAGPNGPPPGVRARANLLTAAALWLLRLAGGSRWKLE